MCDKVLSHYRLLDFSNSAKGDPLYVIIIQGSHYVEEQLVNSLLT